MDKDTNNGKTIFKASEGEAAGTGKGSGRTVFHPGEDGAEKNAQNVPGYVERGADGTEDRAAEGTARGTGEQDFSDAFLEELLKDTFGNRIKQVGRALASAFLVLCVSIGAVWYLSTPAPANTMQTDDPQGYDIKLSDDHEGTKKFTSIKLMEAHEANGDAVGWLTIDGCEIDDVVLQSYDNDYYLRKNEERRYSVWGCYFMDYINIHSGATLYDRVTIIYGHSSGNSANGNKFSKLKRYRDSSFAKEHPVFTFSLLYREYKCEVFACTDMPITINYIDPAPTDARFEETFSYMISHSYVDFGVDLRDDDQIILLSTCTADPDVRFVLAARIITG